jgi:hypothetical protein
MRKKTILAFSALVGCLLISHNALTFTSGAPSGRSGSPVASNGSSCASSSCHNGPAVSTQTISITTDIPANGFAENTDYTITVALDDGGTSTTKAGFMASIEDASGHTGLITPTSTDTKSTGAFITHTSSGTAVSGGAKSFDFTWNSGTAPDGTTIYVAANFSNNGGTAQGDVIALENLSLSKASGVSLKENAILDFDIAPNPAVDMVRLSNLDAQVNQINVYALNGELLKTLGNDSKVTATDWELSVNELSNGTYLVVPSNASMKNAQKLVIAK